MDFNILPPFIYNIEASIANSKSTTRKKKVSMLASLYLDEWMFLNFSVYLYCENHIFHCFQKIIAKLNVSNVQRVVLLFRSIYLVFRF